MFSLLVSLVCSPQPIQPLHTYNSVENGVMLQLDLIEEFETAQLVLLDSDNLLLAPPATVTNGVHDVTSRLPEIKNLQEAAWLQLYIAQCAVGSPIVIQPMVSRDVPITQEALRPDGESTYTKIVGWENEAEEDEIESPFISGWRAYVEHNAVFKTSEGDITVAFRPDEAPNTVWNFLELVRGELYENTVFHRIVPLDSKGNPFVIQGGDPTGTGYGGPGYWLPVEKSELPHDVGVLSMARASDPDSAGSQFFFCLSREGTSRLDGQYCSFGETIEGVEVIQTIAATTLRDPATGSPENPPVVHTIELVPARFREVQEPSG